MIPESRHHSKAHISVGPDLQQPLESLSRLRGMVAKKIADRGNMNLGAQLNEVASTLVDMLEMILDAHPQETKGIGQKITIEPWWTGTQPMRQPNAYTKVKSPTIFLVGSEGSTRKMMLELFQKKGWSVETYSGGEAFLKSYLPVREGCLIIDARLSGMNGLELLKQLKGTDGSLPTLMLIDQADIRLAVRAMKAGAVDFLEKPVQGDELLAHIERALKLTRNSSVHAEAARRIAGLTSRERQVMKLVVEGNPNKQIAYVLGINQRTVETHRATLMKKIGARSLPELIHMTIAVAPSEI